MTVNDKTFALDKCQLKDVTNFFLEELKEKMPLDYEILEENFNLEIVPE